MDDLEKLLGRVRHDFTYHTPNEVARLLHEDTRRVFREFAYRLVTHGPAPTREMSLALTALEEASFWAHENIARNSEARNSDAN